MGSQRYRISFEASGFQLGPASSTQFPLTHRLPFRGEKWYGLVEGWPSSDDVREDGQHYGGWLGSSTEPPALSICSGQTPSGGTSAARKPATVPAGWGCGACVARAAPCWRSLEAFGFPLSGAGADKPSRSEKRCAKPFLLPAKRASANARRERNPRLACSHLTGRTPAGLRDRGGFAAAWAPESAGADFMRGSGAPASITRVCWRLWKTVQLGRPAGNPPPRSTEQERCTRGSFSLLGFHSKVLLTPHGCGKAHSRRRAAAGRRGIDNIKRIQRGGPGSDRDSFGSDAVFLRRRGPKLLL